MKRIPRASSYLFFELYANSTKYQEILVTKSYITLHTISRRKLLRVKEPIDDYGEEIISPVYRAYKSDPALYQLFQDLYNKTFARKRAF